MAKEEGFENLDFSGNSRLVKTRFTEYFIQNLHISLGWLSKGVSHEELDWEKIGVLNTLTLLDPLYVIDGPYLALEGALAACREL